MLVPPKNKEYMGKEYIKRSSPGRDKTLSSPEQAGLHRHRGVIPRESWLTLLPPSHVLHGLSCKGLVFLLCVWPLSSISGPCPWQEILGFIAIQMIGNNTWKYSPSWWGSNSRSFKWLPQLWWAVATFHPYWILKPDSPLSAVETCWFISTENLPHRYLDAT